MVTAWMLDQQEMLSLWWEEPQVSVCLHQVWPLGESIGAWEACGRAKGSRAAGFVPVHAQRLGASGQESQAKCEFPTHILAWDNYFLYAYCVLGTEDWVGSREHIFLFFKLR